MVETTQALADHPGDDDEDERMDLVFEALDDAFCAGEFALVDARLPLVDVTQHNPTVLLGILTMTWHAKEHLPSRPAFLDAAEASMRERLGNERAAKLLENLR